MTVFQEGNEFITRDEKGDKVGVRRFTVEGLEIVSKWVPLLRNTDIVVTNISENYVFSIDILFSIIL